MTKKEFKKRALPVKNKLFRRACFLLSDRKEAEDTVQDVFLKLWNMRDEISEYKSIEALAMTITKNKCIDKLRSYRHRKQNDESIEAIELNADGLNPEGILELNEKVKAIHQLVRNLPEQQQKVIYLHDIEQYSYDEIEIQTGLKRATIRAHVSRARKKVREQYFKKYDYEN